jgi:hypothetical protein
MRDLCSSTSGGFSARKSQMRGLPVRPSIAIRRAPALVAIKAGAQ